MRATTAIPPDDHRRLKLPWAIAGGRPGRWARRASAAFGLIAALALGLATWEGRAEADYLRDVKPLLRERCYACHGAMQQKGGRRLDTVAFMLAPGRHGAVVRPGDATGSALYQRVATVSLEERMPPEHEGEPLTGPHLKILREWIEGGAVAPGPGLDLPEPDPREHWAFQPVRRPVVPDAKADARNKPGNDPRQKAWGRNPIDAWVAREHRVQGLSPLGEAVPEVLVRRLYFDLIGLPPPPEAIEAAQRDPGGRWYEALVEQLLADPRHGERWGRHWMDIWRYSDWWGLGDQLRNSQKHIWHWRDWLVESIQADLPYDEMVRLMLAADELAPEDLGRLRATGFLARNWFLFNRHQWMEETVEHVGKGFLGLTLNCTKCHDHKYDPIPQADFYRMRAFFEPYQVRLDLLPGRTDLEAEALPRVYDGPADVPTYRFVRGQEAQPDTSTNLPPGVPAVLGLPLPAIRPVDLPAEAWQPERRPWVTQDALAAARTKLKSARTEAERRRSDLVEALRREADDVGKRAGPARADRAAAPGAAANAEADRARDTVRGAVDAARRAWDRAEAEEVVAETELASVEARVEAMRVSWQRAEAEPAAVAVWVEMEQAKGEAAVRAVRAAALARARLAVLTAEANVAAAGSDRRAAAEKEAKAAREALEKAVKVAAGPVAPEDRDAYPRLVGARWSATRFRNSGADDPAVPFVAQSSGRRRALAEWITDRRNPLTARVAVNHVWMRHLGAPLVPTVFEFGRKGAPPTHPELLDWLAAEFMEHGWSLKHLHRLIVTSSTYRLSSSLADPAAGPNLARDPDNRFWWRRGPLRLEGEAVRDALLAHAGLLDETRGGPPVPAAAQAASRRRSLYFFHSNNDRNLFLATFDGAMVKECYRRDQSIVPQQALALTNSRLVQETAVEIARRLSRPRPPAKEAVDDDTFVRRAFAQLAGIMAGPAELTASRKALAEWRAVEPAGGSGSSGAATNDVARTRFVEVLINHNDFVTVR